MERRTYISKEGGQRVLVKTIQAEMGRLDFPNASRISTAGIGPAWDTVVHELEFRDLHERAEFWKDWFARPETPAFMEKFENLVKHGGHTEIWHLQE